MLPLLSPKTQLGLALVVAVSLIANLAVTPCAPTHISSALCAPPRVDTTPRPLSSPQLALTTSRLLAPIPACGPSVVTCESTIAEKSQTACASNPFVDGKERAEVAELAVLFARGEALGEALSKLGPKPGDGAFVANFALALHASGESEACFFLLQNAQGRSPFADGEVLTLGDLYKTASQDLGAKAEEPDWESYGLACFGY